MEDVLGDVNVGINGAFGIREVVPGISRRSPVGCGFDSVSRLSSRSSNLLRQSFLNMSGLV